MLVAAGHRRVEALGQRDGFLDRVADDDTRTVQDHGEFRLRQERGGFGNRLATAGRTLQPDDLRQSDLDLMRPEIARDVDLRRCAAAPRLLDHPVEHLGDAGRIANFLLIADHVLEQRHLFDFLEAALPDGLVGRLRRHHQHRRVIPVGRLDRGDEAGHARSVLRHGHRHLAGHARIAVGDQRRVALVRTVPEGDAGFRKQVGDRHHRRADDAEGMLDPVHLQDFDEGLFRRHLHGALSHPGFL